MPEITQPRILLIGTGDTKADELLFMSECITRAGGTTIMMDISVLGDPPYQPAHDKHAVAAAAFELMRLGLVDELLIYVAPMIFGGANAPTRADGLGVPRERALEMTLTGIEQWDDGGVLLKYKF